MPAIPKKRLHITLTLEPGGWLAEVKEIPGCHTAGATVPKTLRRLAEVTGLYEKEIAELATEKVFTRPGSLTVLPEPKKSRKK